MFLAIVGYRDFTDYEMFCKKVNEWVIMNGKPETIISGGCRGTDEMAKKYAEDHKYKFDEYKPNWKKYGKAAGLIRNKIIVDKCTHVIAFLSDKSKGTFDTINKAYSIKKDVTVYKI